MKREEIIEVIDRLRSDSLEVGERARLLGTIHFQASVGHMAPISWASALKRSCLYGWVFVCRLGRMSEDDLRRFRPAERLLGASLTFILVFAALGVFFIRSGPSLIRLISSTGWGDFGIIAFNVLLGTFFILFLLRIRYANRDDLVRDAQRFRPWCIGCGYELEGLESALGDELWVGPEACPECGQKYPAVG